MTVAMKADIRCAASGWTLQVKSAAKRNTASKNTFSETLQNQGKCTHEKAVCVN